jgi:3-deoxy-D-manno-octulosonic-acid transferase
LNLLFYNIGIGLYYLAARFASFFNDKAKKFCDGRKDLLHKIETETGRLRGKDANRPSDDIIWFHCSSVGEFEQARPLIEWFRAERKEYKILLTFFSPSGYELRKNYELADWVFYLPMDLPHNVKTFLDIVRPKAAIFIKYEFWYNYLRILKKRNIDTYIASAIFRPSQIFFKWYGRFFVKALGTYKKIFVQDDASAELLGGLGYKDNVIVSGDTRFDRVAKITSSSGDFPFIKSFAGKGFTIVAGSTWQPDEEILAKVIKNFSSVKIVVVPHEISSERIAAIDMTFKDYKVIHFSSFSEKDEDSGYSGEDVLEKALKKAGEADVMVIDCLGLLSSIYKYGNMAYVGGGFGAGIHNILEAAAYGIPVVFGPKYSKFKEARDMIDLGAALSISGYRDLYDIIDRFLKENIYRTVEKKGAIAGKYVSDNMGATYRITSNLDL